MCSEKMLQPVLTWNTAVSRVGNKRKKGPRVPKVAERWAAVTAHHLLESKNTNP